MVDSKPSHLLIVGDFNYKDIDWMINMVNGSDCVVIDFMILAMTAFSFSMSHNQLRRYRQETEPSVLELVFTNKQNMVSGLAYHSDNCCLTFQFT